jgi:hypothetical protein
MRLKLEISLTETSISTTGTAQQLMTGSLRETSIATTPTKKSETHSPTETPTAKSTTSSNKRKDDETSNQIYGRKYKKMDCQDKIDLILVDALRKSDDSQDKNSTKSSNQLFWESIVELLESSLPKKIEWQEWRYNNCCGTMNLITLITFNKFYRHMSQHQHC